MSEKLSQDGQKAVEELSVAIRSRLEMGENRGKIVQELIRQGWAEESATQLVNDIGQVTEEQQLSPEVRRTVTSKYKRHILYGFLWAGGGTAVTVYSYTATAAEPGGVYLIAWGAILFGAIEFFRGLSGWLQYRS